MQGITVQWVEIVTVLLCVMHESVNVPMPYTTVCVFGIVPSLVLK